MGTALHKDLAGSEQMHGNHRWSYADQTAREAASGFVAADLLKWAHQEDDHSWWVLTGYSPIEWSPLLSSLVDYLKKDGTVAMTGDLNMGGNAITSVGNVDGRDVSADGAALDAHVANTSNPHSVDKTDVGLSNVPNVDCTNATNITSGTLPNSVLPPLAITETFVVASEAAQLALSAQEGDVAIRTDISKTFIHNGGSSGTMADWNELLSPTDAVTSVNGYTGVVVLTKSDVGLGNVPNLDTTSAVANDHTHANKSQLDLVTDGEHDQIVTGNPHNVTAAQAGAIPAPGSPAHGDILYRNASAWTRLPAGTSGQVLQTNGAGANPSWAAVASGGAKHIASGSSLGTSSTTSTSYQQKLRVTTPSLTNGTRYAIFWSMETGCAADEDVGMRCELNDSTELMDISRKNHPYATRYFPNMGVYVSSALSGVVTVDLDYKRDYGMQSVYARYATILVLEIPS